MLSGLLVDWQLNQGPSCLDRLWADLPSDLVKQVSSGFTRSVSCFLQNRGMVHWPQNRSLEKLNITKSVVCSKVKLKPQQKAAVKKKNAASDMTGNMDRLIVVSQVLFGIFWVCVCVCDLDLIQSLLAYTCFANESMVLRWLKTPTKWSKKNVPHALNVTSTNDVRKAKSWGLPYGRGSRRQGQKVCFSSPRRTPGCSKKLPM